MGSPVAWDMGEELGLGGLGLSSASLTLLRFKGSVKFGF